MKYLIKGAERCTYCVHAKNLLESKSLPYEWVNIDINEEARNELKTAGFRTIPQIWHGESHIGGYAELLSYLGDN